MTVGCKKTEVGNFDLTARDIPNFNRTPRIEKLEEVVGTLMEEVTLLKGQADRPEGFCDSLRVRIERLEKERGGNGS